MNGRERDAGVLDGRRVDFLPRVPILMQFAAEYIGSHYGEFASDYRVLVRANAECARAFGMDQVSAISDLDPVSHRSVLQRGFQSTALAGGSPLLVPSPHATIWRHHGPWTADR